MTILASLALLIVAAQEVEDPGGPRGLSIQDVAAAGRVVGLPLSDAELELMLDGVANHLADYERLRARELPNSLQPALAFTPLVPGVEADPWRPPPHEIVLPEVERPEDLGSLRYADVLTLAALVRSRQVRCVELVEMFTARLRQIDERLHCVVTYTTERALAQAALLDAELEAGSWRGVLHGLPWGAKDLLATKGYRTTWGAAPFAEQVLDLDATVVEKLDAAGAILVAKLALGELAWGDVWFGGRTASPWNPEKGSSGSSAGPAAATAAGGVVFSIGSETWGSLVSPSDRCGTSALRPTFGRVSRHGAMSLAWSLDKLGPLARSVDDLALVFDAILGPDGKDLTVAAQPWALPGAADVKGWRVGYLAQTFEERSSHASVLDELAALGVELVPLALPELPVEELMFVLSAEAACAFDELTRGDQDDQLVRQVERAWPNELRVARLIPAVEYLRAQRLRTELCQAMATWFEDVVAYVHPSLAGDSLALTNLTGHPALVAPCGFTPEGEPYSVTFTGRLYDEARLLALASAWQRSTAHHRRHP